MIETIELKVRIYAYSTLSKGWVTKDIYDGYSARIVPSLFASERPGNHRQKILFVSILANIICFHPSRC